MNQYFVVEDGKLTFYEYEDGTVHRRWAARRVAVAFDAESLRFYRFGPPELLMAWATSQRHALREQSRSEDADNLGVALLPAEYNPIELNRMLQDPAYSTVFLQKAGFV